MGRDGDFKGLFSRLFGGGRAGFLMLFLFSLGRKNLKIKKSSASIIACEKKNTMPVTSLANNRPRDGPEHGGHPRQMGNFQVNSQCVAPFAVDGLWGTWSCLGALATDLGCREKLAFSRDGRIWSRKSAERPFRGVVFCNFRRSGAADSSFPLFRTVAGEKEKWLGVLPAVQAQRARGGTGMLNGRFVKSRSRTLAVIAGPLALRFFFLGPSWIINAGKPPRDGRSGASRKINSAINLAIPPDLSGIMATRLWY